MKSIFTLIFLSATLPLFAWEPTLTATSAEQVIASISNDLPDVSANALILAAALPGQYSPGGRSGSTLYLFSDGAYIVTEHLDILPETIFEKGDWTFQDGVVIITPDGSLPKMIFPKDHRFLLLSLREQTNNFLMGANWQYSYLMENKRPGNYFMFKLCAFEQKEHYDGTNDDNIKADLMNRAWKPEEWKNE